MILYEQVCDNYSGFIGIKPAERGRRREKMATAGLEPRVSGCSLAVPPRQYERRIGRAVCCDGFVAQCLWRLQSETLGSSPAVAVFSLLLSL